MMFIHHYIIYYFILFGIFSENTFTKWTGISLNLIIFTFICYLLYLIGKKLFKSEKWAFLLVLLYGISNAGIYSTIYIRMYELLILAGLIFFNISINIIEKINKNEILEKKDYIQIFFSIIFRNACTLLFYVYSRKYIFKYS